MFGECAPCASTVVSIFHGQLFDDSDPTFSSAPEDRLSMVSCIQLWVHTESHFLQTIAFCDSIGMKIQNCHEICSVILSAVATPFSHLQLFLSGAPCYFSWTRSCGISSGILSTLHLTLLHVWTFNLGASWWDIYVSIQSLFADPRFSDLECDAHLH